MKKLTVFILIVLLIWSGIWISNKWVQTTEYTVTSEKLPEAFDGTRIVQVSDLHNATFGRNQSSLIEKVEAAGPDAIFLTGDLVDSNRYDLGASLVLVDALVEMSSVYYVTGNHEVASNQVAEIASALRERGVVVLADESVEWEKAGATIQVAGIDDPLMVPDIHEDEATQNSLEHAQLTDDFTLLLAHRPEYLSVYAEEEVDVVFSGHAHGGQIRIPGLGGLIAPGQGWFPKVTEGIFEKDQTEMVVSRGLGNSTFPVRIFNLPEVVVVTLEKE
ncbi:metallophosphoesterase ykuE [Planococcus antarcticus DSM 14505]|uniref:Phosphoesterase n=1 Tax=Planococcus antarcticus DSM 14505 TaxID=1185653 RepID=A0A1C7DEF6_9BACL|nr:metallophosphoesterase [Planococcus antarcticus]ANU09825.1 phosphoesterase [Planococcus antarcticus DSM 14505]EIM07572.1 metallophosphoesterase ykuE [Planococcus antarcticus DSM 14505]